MFKNVTDSNTAEGQFQRTLREMRSKKLNPNIQRLTLLVESYLGTYGIHSNLLNSG